MNNYYVYIWYVISTGYVFYVGKGHGDRCCKKSKRNNTFNSYINNFDCAYSIIENNLSEQQAFDREIYYISYYKNIGMADANYHKGGESGGNVFEFMPKNEYDNFVTKMTEINKARCSSEEFKNNARKRMINKYSDKNERKLQSEKLKEVWRDDALREKQRQNRIEYLKTHPESTKCVSEAQSKRCAMELNGETKEFNSKKELFKYLKEEHNLSLSRKTEQELFNENKEYKCYTNRKSYMNGMRLYYI